MAEMSRRKFGKMVAGGTALFAIPPARANGFNESSSNIAGVQIGVMSYSFRDRPLQKALETTVGLGISSMEICGFCHLDAQKVADEELKSWRRKFQDAGVKISAYYGSFRKEATDQQIDRVFAAARLLGTSVITTSVVRDTVPRIDKAAQQSQTLVGLHNHWFNHPDPQQFAGPEDFEWALSHFSKWININLDVGHFYASGYDPVKFFDTHHQRIVSLHIKDRGDDPEHTDHAFGEGSTPVIPMIKACRRDHFKYPASIEWEVKDSDPVKGVSGALAYIKAGMAG
jgi:sugar phosphate isomerase/epimerase